MDRFARLEVIPTATINDPGTEKPWLRKQRPWRRRDGVFRFTINQFDQPDELGFFEDRRVELIDGVIFELAQYPDHSASADFTVEISSTSPRKDRTIKAHLYSQANLREYWIVNLAARQIEVHRDPGSDPERKGRFPYASVTIVADSGTISPLAAPDSVVPVSDFLP